MEKYECVDRISSSYINDDCCQIMLGHDPKEYLTVVDSTGVTLYCDEKGNCIYNSYLGDDRRYSFPYANIPTHKSLQKLHRRVFVNQILDFDRMYLDFYRGCLISRYAVKNGDEGFLVTTLYKPDNDVQTMTKEEVSNYINSFDVGFINPNDGKLTDYTFPSEEVLLERYKRSTRKLKSRMHFPSEDLDRIFERAINELTLEDIPTGSTVFDGYYGVKTDGKEITDVKFITISFNKEDSYNVETLDFPVCKYSLEDVNEMLKFKQAGNVEEPRFSRIVNRDITKETIRQGKNKVYRLDKTFE